MQEHTKQHTQILSRYGIFKQQTQVSYKVRLPNNRHKFSVRYAVAKEQTQVLRKVFHHQTTDKRYAITKQQTQVLCKLWRDQTKSTLFH